jgi:hypothetical protein
MCKIPNELLADTNFAQRLGSSNESAIDIAEIERSIYQAAAVTMPGHNLSNTGHKTALKLP